MGRIGRYVDGLTEEQKGRVVRAMKWRHAEDVLNAALTRASIDAPGEEESDE